MLGASAGGIEALVALFARLPSDLQAALAVVLHRSRTFEGRLEEVLGRERRYRYGKPTRGTD